MERIRRRGVSKKKTTKGVRERIAEEKPYGSLPKGWRERGPTRGKLVETEVIKGRIFPKGGTPKEKDRVEKK